MNAINIKRIKMEKYFNTSGPNIEKSHYTLIRTNYITQGINLVRDERYFTIWAPRQTGKSTYFRQLAVELEKGDYKVCHVNLENDKESTLDDLLIYLLSEINIAWESKLEAKTFKQFQKVITDIKSEKCVLIIDEIEGLNPALLNQFLHTIRSLYHSRENHCLKSVVLVGVSNIIGIIKDNASPFNIADNLELGFFTDCEARTLLEMHEKATGQLFAEDVKLKIMDITANQPGLVNAFAQRLITQYPNKNLIDYCDYLEVERWFLNETIDKNIQNIKNKASEYRSFVEKLLFSEKKIPYQIDTEAIEFLHSQGLVEQDEDYNTKIWVPLYKKKLFTAFYPYSNGESNLFFREVDPETLVENNILDYDRIIDNYKKYVLKRGFRYFREKDKDTGEYLTLKESALVYSFETYIQYFLEDIEGKSYLEPHTGLGRTDLLINIGGKESVIEFKVYKSPSQFRKGKAQVAYYAKSQSLNEAIYLVFVPNDIKFESVKEAKNEKVKDVSVTTYIVRYDEEKDFG